MVESSPKPVWWTVARSEEVTDKKPLGVDIGEQPIVLWRDKGGVARALEDRCPHRRAPLSRGCVRDNGWLQCGYHGWSYEGETGRLKEIPNMKEQQKFPPLYKAMAFAVAESDGFVRVSLDPQAAAPDAAGRTLGSSGTASVSLAHRHYLDALYDDPGLVIAIRGVEFTPYLLSELHEENGQLVMERNCLRKGLHWPASFKSDFPMTLLTATEPLTGETALTLRNADLKPLLHAIMAPVPAARGTTAIRWRMALGGAAGPAMRRGDPFRVLDAIDGARLRATLPSVSLHGAQLKERMLAGTDSVARAAA